MLYDGKTDPPAEAWIPWEMVGTFAETSPLNYILIDAYRTQMQVMGVTLVEDAARPESWLRDASIDYWDAAKELWIPIQPLRSDAAVHTHMFAQPVRGGAVPDRAALGRLRQHAVGGNRVPWRGAGLLAPGRGGQAPVGDAL